MISTSKINRSELKVTRIGLGTNAVGGHNLFAGLREEDGIYLAEEALAQGINFFDTADAYGFGRSEELLGQVLVSRRKDVILATKGGIERKTDGTTEINNHPAYLRKALELSLKRLQTDYIDLYYIHYPDHKTPICESVGELSRFIEEGKVKAIGVSNFTMEQLQEANRHAPLSALQSPYSMLERSAEKALLPYCASHNISFIAYGPLSFGILGGQYTKEYKLQKGDWRTSLDLFQPQMFDDNLFKIEKLKLISKKKDCTLPQIALAWLLNKPGVTAVIPGAKTKDQVTMNAAADSIQFSEQELKEIDIILGGN